MFLTVDLQCGERPAILVGLDHRACQALADPLLLGDIVLLEHRPAIWWRGAVPLTRSS
jgi:hypothetical protein